MAVKNDRRFKINGRPFLWRYTRLRGDAVGWAYVSDHLSPHGVEKILVDDRLKGRSRMDTEIHEFLHAANPSMCEEYVKSQANDLSRILWALGYRRVARE